MFTVILYLIVLVLFRVAAQLKRAPKPRGLCAECAFAHIQHGANARSATFCTYGGVVRPVKLDVMYCTDYRDRNAAPRLVRIGFAFEEMEPDGAAVARVSAEEGTVFG